MADPKNRIISHMNKDHQMALVDYTVVYGSECLGEFQPETVAISDVDIETLTLSYVSKDGSTRKLPLRWNDTPDDEGVKVAAMSDIKAKLIAMAKYAAAKRGLSHKQVKTIIWPSFKDSVVLYSYAALTVATLFKKDILRVICQKLFTQMPGGLLKFLNFYEKYYLTIAVVTYVCHIFEMIFLVYPKTVKYRMPSRVQITYLLFNFFEGYFMFKRLKSATE